MRIFLIAVFVLLAPGIAAQDDQQTIAGANIGEIPMFRIPILYASVAKNDLNRLDCMPERNATATLLDTHKYKVMEFSKIEVLEGRCKGQIGWMFSNNLSAPK